MPHDWHAFVINLFHLGTGVPAISVLEKLVRPVVVYLFLVFALRAYGKRVLAQLNPFDFVVLLTLANTVQNAIIGNDTSLSGGIIGAAALLAVNALLVRIYYRNPREDRMVIEDHDLYLIKNYLVQEPALARLHINRGELTAKAHERGFDTLNEVETAVLYPNGTIYMKAGAQSESAQLEEIAKNVAALRQEVAMLARGRHTHP